jgi:hypothetical protein
MTPELDTLDQLLGSDLPLALVRGLYPDACSYRQGILGLLSCGDVSLVTSDGVLVPAWRWRELFADGGDTEEIPSMLLSITDQGVRRIA